MDLRLRSVLVHPRSGIGRTDYAFSTRYPRIICGAQDVLVDFNTTTSSMRASIRTPAKIEKLVYVGAVGCFLVFLENDIVLSYSETPSNLVLSHEKRLGGAGRSITLACGSQYGRIALYSKSESPSVWCILVSDDGSMESPFKLRSDIEGDQDNVNLISGTLAKVRGKVSTKTKSKPCPVAAIATHATRSYVTAAYTNGIVRVWDIGKKQQRNHFDAQLLMRERIVDVAMHPNMMILTVCTSLGRVISFQIKNGLYRRGDEPALAVSKVRDRKRNFRVMCFTQGDPSYLLLLTSTQRVVVKMINRSGIICGSTRYQKASRVLTGELSGGNEIRTVPELTDENAPPLKETEYMSMIHDGEFGFLACTFDKSQRICLFQPAFDGVCGIPRSITCGIDSGFPSGNGKEWTGAVGVVPETLIVHQGFLFRYSIGTDQVTKLCRLPEGTPHRLEVARDEFGYSIGAIVFYYGDDPISPHEYSEATTSPRYVLCTKRDEKEAWNVSEPAEGRSGCFLNSAGNHDRVLIIASSGVTASLFSFAGQKGKDGQPVRQSRGVQRFKLSGRNVQSVFRAPFASWNAILYHDINLGQVAISKNTFHSHYEQDSMDGSNITHQMQPDDATALTLQDREIVLDVRWQRLPSRGRRNTYLGAILTDRSIYFVRDVLEMVSKFPFQRISRIIVPYSIPSSSWMGPTFMILFGNAIFSIAIDGNYDLVANISHGEHVSCLAAVLPDRVIYTRHSRIHNPDSISAASRPISPMSGILRGMLALIQADMVDGDGHTQRIREVLNSHDASQSSLNLAEALTRSNLTGIAYLLAVCEQGQRSVPPLARAMFLGKIGDVRGSLSIAESEYSKLSDDMSFHDGTELYRLLQRILNVAFASYDFAVGERCSKLLGRKGTFASFIDCEGGYEAVKSLLDAARNGVGPYPTEVLQPLIEKSSSSCIALDSSSIPSQRKVDKMRRAKATVNTKAIPLGSEDNCQMFIRTQPQIDENNTMTNSQLVQVEPVALTKIIDRFAIKWVNNVQELSGIETNEMLTFEEFNENIEDSETIAESTTMAETEAKTRSFNDADNDSSDDSEIDFTAESGDASSSHPTASALSSAVSPTEESAIGIGSSGSGSASASVQQASSASGSQKPSSQTESTSQSQKLSSVSIPSHDDTESLLVAQHNTGKAGANQAKEKALFQGKRGLKRYDNQRFEAAQKEFDLGLRAFERAVKNGIMGSDGSWGPILQQLSFYSLASRVRSVLSQIGSSTHANTPDGRRTYASLATKLTRIPLQPKHVIDSIMLGVDANMMVQNFGVASQGLKALRERGVGRENEALRTQLREKYAVCQARGFTDSNILPAGYICWETLELVQPGSALGCVICPAKFKRNSFQNQNGNPCPRCKIGNVRIM